MTEDWRNSIDNKEAVVAVAVDLSKAFDAINHSLLLAKLKAYGFSSAKTYVASSLNIVLLNYLFWGHQERTQVATFPVLLIELGPCCKEVKVLDCVFARVNGSSFKEHHLLMSLQ